MNNNSFKSRGGIARIGRACLYSLRGLGAAWRHEAAFRQEIALIVVLTPCAFWLATGIGQFFALMAPLLLILVVELVNSAIEALADAISIEHNPLLGRAKDLGSAAVALAFVVAACVWADAVFSRFLA